jgi:purine-nucleoside phosphorylase
LGHSERGANVTRVLRIESTGASFDNVGMKHLIVLKQNARTAKNISEQSMERYKWHRLSM